MTQPLNPNSDPPPESHPPAPPVPDPTVPLSRWRLGWLGVNVLLLVTGFAWVGLDPKVGKLQAYTFPETVALPHAQLKTSEVLEPVEKPEYEGSSYASGRHYQYRYRGQPLAIEIRYVIDTLGGVDKFTREHPKIEAIKTTQELNGQVRFLDDVGNYAFVTHDNVAYISACINPRGQTTATAAQYERNQELYDMVVGRLGVWLLGRERWRDDRCLWTFMYMPLGEDTETAIAHLEAAWHDWARHWQRHFPPL